MFQSFALDPMLAALVFPQFDPIAVSIFGFAVRWYALSYIASIILCWFYVRHLARRHPGGPTVQQVDDIVLWITIGIVLGGRLGYVIFYKPGHFLQNPGEIFSLWQGGMSFHGGFLGVILAMILFSRSRKLGFWTLADRVACSIPIGLFFGRIANFVNGELWGRTTDVPWGMVFPGAGPLPRHPSQLYEALLEGIVLFAFLWIVRRKTGAMDRPGTMAGWFCVGYAVTRSVSELFREPDAHLGFLFAGTTMGQLLCIPLLIYGIYLLRTARRRAAPSTP